MMHYLKVPHRKSLRSQYVKSILRCVAIIVLLSLCCHQNVEYYVLGLDGDGNFSAQRKRRAETSSHYAYRSQAVLEDPPYAEKRCPERPEKASISMNKVKSWEDLKGILENLPSHSEFVLPSFQVTKTKRDNPIVLRSALQLSCISRGACIIIGDQDEGGGGFVIIQGARAKVRLQGITFLNASDTAVVVSKKAGLSKDGNPALEQIFCECHFFNNNGGEGGAIRADSRTRVHIESSVFSRNYSTLGTGNTDNSGVGGGAIHNNAESMNVWFSTFDNNSAQIGVIYTHPESTLFISQNTFLLGDDEREYESAAVYVYAQDISSFVDNGGNRGYDRNGGEDKDFSYCNGVYVNNEDECIPFGDIPSTSGNENDSSGRECIDAHGVFRSHRGTLKRCDWLAIGSRKNRNCNGKTELGRMCCEECSSMPSTSNIRGGSKDQSVPEATGNPSTHPTALPTVLPLERPSITPVLPPNEGDIKDIVFYVLGDAPYQRKEFDDDQFPKQVRDIPNDSDFVFHVGDMQRTKTSLCNITWYQHVADILRYSTSPVFITPGDNDWLDCEPYIGSKQGWGHWRNTFGFFDSHWQPHKFKLVRQPNLLENVSFLYQRVLFVVVHLVSDYFDIESERKYRHTEQLKWTKEQIAINKGFFDSIVIIGHSPPSALNRDFFSAKESGISETVSELGIPVVYIHGSGHKFVEEEQFNKLDNFLRIQIPGRTSNPVKVTIKNSNMFLFDFRDGNTTTQCCENGWPHISKLNDVILQFDSR